MTISGMTGFARRDGGQGRWTWSIEARSVNGRGLEIRYKGPPGFDGLERAVREAAQSRFSRGQVAVALQARPARGESRVRVDLPALERLLALCQPYLARGEAAAPRMDGLLALRGVMEFGDEEPVPEPALEAGMTADLEAALDALKASRDEEGRALATVLGGLLDVMTGLTEAARAEAAAQPQALKERLQRRLSELLSDRAGLEDRIVQEAALLASRADVREELDRLTLHLASARSLLASPGPAGRKLDFLTQEFMREANTLCSKSALSALTATGLDLKAVIEQFREQVQNVE